MRIKQKKISIGFWRMTGVRGAMPTAVPGRKPMYIMNWES